MIELNFESKESLMKDRKERAKATRQVKALSKQLPLIFDEQPTRINKTNKEYIKEFQEWLDGGESGLEVPDYSPPF